MWECATGAHPHPSSPIAGDALGRAQLNVSPEEADVTRVMACALGIAEDLVTGLALGFSQLRNEAPLVHDSLRAPMQVNSAT